MTYTGSESNIKWCGYDYVVNRVSPGGNEAIIEKYSENGTWNEVGRAKFKVEGNKMMLEVSREVLGIPDNNGKGVINVQFKWADNYQLDEDNTLDIFSFYKNGDVAPYGRLNYVFSEEPSTNKK